MSRKTRLLSEMFETVSLGAPDRAVGFVLWRVVHLFVREVDRALTPLELTHLQFTTLAMAAWLERSGEPVTQSKIAAYAEIHPMQVSQMLKILESKSLVARVRSAIDSRAKQVAVTTVGIQALRRAMPLVIAVQRRLFGHEAAPDGALLAMLLRIDSGGSDPPQL